MVRNRRSSNRRQAVGDDSPVNLKDVPRLTDRQSASMVRLRSAPSRKVAVSVRLDARVLEWLKSRGSGHLTLINDILANMMEANQRTIIENSALKKLPRRGNLWVTANLIEPLETEVCRAMAKTHIRGGSRSANSRLQRFCASMTEGEQTEPGQ